MKQAATRGFVLLNALVLVAAFAAVSVVVLQRAEATRQRQASLQDAVQMRLYLDAFEALVLTQLRRDQLGGSLDHLGEAWAAIGDPRAPAMILDRAEARGQVADLQGRFNVNWLANPGDTVARDSFARLLVQLGLPSRLGGQIIGFLDPGGPANAAAYGRLQPAVVPLGGPVQLLEQLQTVPGLSPRHYARLAPYLAALPGDSRLNLNTTSPEVLTSLLPGSNRGGLTQALASRSRQPFVSLEDFAARAALSLPEGGLPETIEPRLAVGSGWFHATIAVALGPRILSRQTTFHRRPLPYGPQVAHRLEIPE